MSRWRKKFDRLEKTELKRQLAIRDGLVPKGIFEKTPNPHVRCAECDSLVPFEEPLSKDRLKHACPGARGEGAVKSRAFPIRRASTLGHIVPRSDGGGDQPSNLRLECDLCNQLDADRRHTIRSILKKPEEKISAKERRRLFAGEERVRKERKGHLYDSIEVLDVHGETISFTSLGRARRLVEIGRVRLQAVDEEGRPKTVQLVEDRPIKNPYQAPHQNLCVICDARRYLRAVNLWPRWHPEWNGAKKSHRTVPLCLHCSSEVRMQMAAILRENGIPLPPERSQERTAAHAVRTALRLHRAGLPIPDPLVKKAGTLGGISLTDYFSSTDPEETERNLRAALKEQTEILLVRNGVWKWAVRRWVVEEKIDYDALFWAFAERRRAEFAPYLRTDGRFWAELRSYLRRVREERKRDLENEEASDRRSPLLLHARKRRGQRSWSVGRK